MSLSMQQCSVVVSECLFLYIVVLLLPAKACFSTSLVCCCLRMSVSLQHCFIVASENLFLYSIVLLLPLVLFFCSPFYCCYIVLSLHMHACFHTSLFCCCLRMSVSLQHCSIVASECLLLYSIIMFTLFCRCI